jgi:NhaA family Na+:H+ antiporter
LGLPCQFSLRILAFIDETIIAAVKLGVFATSFLAARIGVALLLKEKPYKGVDS